LYGVLVGTWVLVIAALAVALVVAAAVLAAGSLSPRPVVYALAALGTVAAAIVSGAIALPLYRWSVSAPGNREGLGQRRRRDVWRRGMVGTALWAVVAIAVCAVGSVLMGVFQLSAENHPWGTVMVIGAAALAALAIVAGVERLAGGSVTAPVAITIAPGIVILIFALAGAFAGQQVHDTGELHDYCYYGSVSDAEVTGCLSHVTTAHIDQLDTNAARFAKGDINRCLDDAGPYCAQALDERNNPPDDPNQ
jgi:hypothetical protein